MQRDVGREGSGLSSVPAAALAAPCRPSSAALHRLPRPPVQYADHDQVRDEFELFCKIGLDATLRAAVEAIPFDSLGLEEGVHRCPPELRHRRVTIDAEVLDPQDEIQQVLQLEFEFDQFVRLRTFLERFSREQVRTLQSSMKT